MSFDLMPAQKFGNVVYAYEKKSGDTSSLATYSENQIVKCKIVLKPTGGAYSCPNIKH